MKLCTAFAMGYTSPELSGTVEIDETFFRENQKNTHDEKKLLDYSHNLQNRPARSGVLCGLATPPAYGTTSPEYITVVTAIDEHKHIVIALQRQNMAISETIKSPSRISEEGGKYQNCKSRSSAPTPEISTSNGVIINVLFATRLMEPLFA